MVLFVHSPDIAAETLHARELSGRILLRSSCWGTANEMRLGEGNELNLGLVVVHIDLGVIRLSSVDAVGGHIVAEEGGYMYIGGCPLELDCS